jgi:3-hydroxyisobutyrate dehydrogenase-like beta-hydroxyacid dehydrogenase
MAKIGFCGLGRMGAPMAARLLGAGHDVKVWNRSKEKAEALGERGASVTATPREAADGSDVVISMLADEDAVKDVVLGRGGVAEGLPPGSVLVEMSTIGPDAVRRLRSAFPDEARLVDAPVLGSTPQAEAGRLQIFVGGDAETVDEVFDVLRAMGEPRHVGDLGAGAALKLVVNSTLGAVMIAVGEALALARALGVDEEVTLDVLSGSYVGGVIQSKRGFIDGTGEETHFALRLAAKDLQLITRTAERAGIRLRTAEANRLTYEEAAEQGLADEDYGAIITYLRDRAGSPAA